MRFRSAPLLVGLGTALGCVACSDGSDDGPSGTGQGGSSGSAGAGSASGAPGSGGTTSEQATKAGLWLSLHPPNMAMPYTECFPAGESSLGDPAPTREPLDPGEPASDGEADVTVLCSVKGPDTFSVSATVAQDNLRFKVSDGTIDAAAGIGTFELLIDTEAAGNIVTEVEQLCTFDVSQAPLEVSEGNLFATFECPVLWNHATATDTACGAEGVLVLRRCAE